MSETAEQSKWIKAVLGFDIEAALAGEEMAKGPDGQDPDGQDQARGGFLDLVKRNLEEFTGERPPVATDKDLADALDKLDDQIEVVEELGINTKQLMRDRHDCAWAGDKAEKLAVGDARTKALDSAKKRIADLTKHVEALAASAKSVMGTGTGKPTADQKSQIYKKALEDHYGIKIENPDNMANTHFDRVFDMFATVPVGDAKQDKMKELRYIKDPGWAGSGAYNKVQLAVKMGDFGDASGMEDYEIDGEVLPANSFDVTTLHEIGHAVDFKHGIMTSNGKKAGCGNWEKESVDSVATIYLPELKKTGLSDKAKDEDLTKAIKAALSAGTTTKPNEIEQPDWEKVVDFLTKNCLAIRASNSPWFKAPVVVGSRVYQEAYGNQWWSYDSGARAATKVNNYQWRAPGEWFAEVYAITWLKKKKPPSGVDAAVAEYMWKG